MTAITAIPLFLAPQASAEAKPERDKAAGRFGVILERSRPRLREAVHRSFFRLGRNCPNTFQRQLGFQFLVQPVIVFKQGVK